MIGILIISCSTVILVTLIICIAVYIESRMSKMNELDTEKIKKDAVFVSIKEQLAAKEETITALKKTNEEYMTILSKALEKGSTFNVSQDQKQ